MVKQKKCQICKRKVSAGDEYLVLNNDYGFTYMHNSCFDGMWEFYDHRKEFTRRLGKLCRIVNKFDIKHKYMEFVYDTQALLDEVY